MKSKKRFPVKQAKSAGLLLLVFIAFMSCSPKEKTIDSKPLNLSFSQYSEFVKDTFYIDVQLPKTYFEDSSKAFSAVYLLDGNFYTPIVAPIQHQYEETGLLDPKILISISYKDFKSMDSLRVRDYLYPKSIASDGMEAPGGGQNFKSYITNELIPMIDAEFRTGKHDRTLVGHSFGGYFVLYALHDQLENNETHFKSFISASPTLWYNDFYLNRLPEALRKRNKNLNLFLTVGGDEHPEWSVKPVIDFSNQIKEQEIKEFKFINRVYNNLGHMDTGLISYIKGLQELKK
ncbi:alpha/beta hydrolase (plasmid) [Fulvitalea axinellae]|uniref:Alpha/beta hydrolase n=1 Tax=Fulvitalea axinellae TaxID=1182444 RepID=A0AAU9DDX2_9BACT|nr:alpha/beta hydrolase [Fulvitalea axinellae]